MTPTELNTYCRQSYNAVSDDFFSDTELYTYAWHAQSILAKDAKLIENTYTTTTVASQQEYTYPTNAIAIKRITWDGKRLTRITFREDDWLTGFDSDTTSTGTPTAYALFDRVIYLRPIPAGVYTLKIFTFDNPEEVTASSSLSVPSDFHLDLVSFMLWRMCLKDQNFEAAQYHKMEWEAAVARAKMWARKRFVADGFNVVRNEDDILMGWENL